MNPARIITAPQTIPAIECAANFIPFLDPEEPLGPEDPPDPEEPLDPEDPLDPEPAGSDGGLYGGVKAGVGGVISIGRTELEYLMVKLSL